MRTARSATFVVVGGLAVVGFRFDTIVVAAGSGKLGTKFADAGPVKLGIMVVGPLAASPDIEIDMAAVEVVVDSFLCMIRLHHHSHPAGRHRSMPPSTAFPALHSAKCPTLLALRS